MGSIQFDDAAASSHDRDKLEPIAIIGMATRFPQEATNNENLWKFLLKARSAHTPFPDNRINSAGHYHPDPEHGGTFAVKGGHFLSENPAYFDAPFFSTTKSEVMSLDPQQRAIMENVYQALENAGIPMNKATSSNTSVFVSGFNHDHLATLNTDPETTLKYKPTGTTNSLLSNRVSWFFDFKATSLTLDTACSSSMVALHLGCQSLRYGESDMSVISGVTMISFPTDITNMGYHGFLSQEGRCFSFDHRADGYARGEGVGTVIVKRLADALKDGDTIRAVIRGTGVNQDGRTAGISLPSATAQEALIRSVYANAGLDLKDTMMVEAHGTGTAAGDPIEARAIANAFSSRSKDIPLYVGAIKSGIGHLEGGAGIAGIIKGVLVLESGIIPPNVNFEKVNPKIPIEKWNIQFPLENTPWPSPGLRRMSINSFGVGGTNAHTVLEDAYHYLNSRDLKGFHNTTPNPPTAEEISHMLTKLEPDVEDFQNGVSNNGTTTNGNGFDAEDEFLTKAPRLLVFTSFDEEGVKRNASVYGDYFKTIQPPKGSNERLYLDNLAYTLSNKRTLFPWRSYCLASTFSGLVDTLTSLRGLSKAVRARTQPKIAFVFTGQGAQWYAMGRELLVYPVFKKSIMEATAYMKTLGAEWSLIDELHLSKEETRVNQPFLAHPSCAALQMALVDLLASWGVLPSRVVGHSSGEIAAAYCAGKLGREAAWKAAYFRGFVSAKKLHAKGAMMAVGLSTARLLPFLKQVNDKISGELIIACFNSPSNNTISGDEVKIDALKEILNANSIFALKLKVANAYHSSHMKSLADEYLSSMGDLSSEGKILKTGVHMFSSVTGAIVDQEHLDAKYWVQNMASPVRFTDALLATCFSRISKGQASLRMNTSAENIFADTIIEIGPHSALQSAIKETLLSNSNGSLISYLPVLNRSDPGLNTILNTVGFLTSRGSPVDIRAVNESAECVEVKPHMLATLPPYSFNHSELVFYESRLSRNHRLRKYPRHDLFGAPVADWNAESPRWRHILRISEQPWLRDHVVTDAFVFPGVGYLIAVVEASRQIADPKSKLKGFRLRDISLKRALLIPDNKEGVEVNLSLSRMDESSLWGSATWKKFQISSYNPIGDDWIEHCTGYIAVDYETAPGPIDNEREAKAEMLQWKEALKSVSERCTVPVDIDDTYDNLVTAGLMFGPLFRNLSDVKGRTGAQGEVTGVITIPDIAKAMPKNFTHPHLIHPATMDSMMHFFIASVMNQTGKNTLDRAMVPTFIKDVWISADIENQPSHTFRAHGSATFLAYDKYQGDVTVWDGVLDEARVTIRGIRATPLESMDASTGRARKLCHNIVWKPDSELLTLSAFEKVPLTTDQDNIEYKYWINRFQLATLLQVTDALKELEGFDPSTLEGHFLRYFKWMKQLNEWLEADQISGMKLSEWQEYTNSPDLKAKLYEQVQDHNADGKFAMRMGSNIVKVLRKEVDPLHLMFGQDDLLDHVYEQVVKLGDLPALQKEYLSAVAHSSTNLNILEVGAGTGSSTAFMLDSLVKIKDESGEIASAISRYTFTDISAGFFEKAKEKFKAYGTLMEFKTLNVEKDVAAQGFESQFYDVIVAGNVIHATADLRKTLGNLQKLLKPGGKLMLQEGIRQDFLWSPLSFGQLPGWWLGVEPARRWSPFSSVSQWDAVLKDAGFSGVDLNLGDRKDPDLHTQSLMIATVATENTDTAPRRQWGKTILVRTSHEPNAVASELKSYLEKDLRVADCSVMHYSELASADLHDAICVSLMELERPVLETLEPIEYENIQQMLATCGGMIWITGDTLEHPELNMIQGLIRTVRWERDIDEANLVTLSIANPQPMTSNLAKAIGKLYSQQFLTNLPESKINGEYMLDNGIFLTARLIDADDANNYITSRFSRPPPIMQPLGQAGRPVKLATSSPGLLNKLEFITDPVYNEPLGPTQVEIEIKAVGLNFRDLMIAMGEHMAYSFGNEAGGLISRVGSAVDRFKPGDRVVYMCGIETTGCFHTFGRVDQNVVVHIPASMSYEIAASLPCVYATVIYGLLDAGRLQKGEKILIHAAAGGVGQAAINFSKHVGAEIFATVSSLEKKELLMTEYGIPEDHIFSSRDLTFIQGIMRVTKNKGVDVVLNSLAGEALRRSWDLLAPFGRFVEIGKKDAQANGKVELHPFLRNVTMTSVELPTMMRHRPELIARLTEDTMRLYAEGAIKEAIPTRIMSFSEIGEGLRILQSGKGMGKMVFKPNPEDVVPLVPEELPPYNLDGKASYVLAGGLGGLGRSLAGWMVDRGAKSLIFLSRSGKITEPVKEMTTDLESKGCRISIFTCDVSDKARLATVIEECKASLPPIKGCIQGSMTLQDKMFENMPYELFQTAVKPKVQGSWNLHELLPPDMDFFVLLSSATGILGNRSQANYAAGNTYQDALARHRVSKGLPAATIDLGTVLSVGYVAENKDKTMMAKHLGTILEVLREDEIHTLIEYLMDPRSQLSGTTCQLVSGLTDANMYHQRGIPMPTYLGYPLFTHLCATTSSNNVTSQEDHSIAVQTLLSVPMTLEKAAEIVASAIQAKLSSLLAMPQENIDPSKSISSNGVDSLVAMEFRTYLVKSLGADIPLLDIMGTDSILTLSQKVASSSKLVKISSSGES